MHPLEQAMRGQKSERVGDAQASALGAVASEGTILGTNLAVDHGAFAQAVFVATWATWPLSWLAKSFTS